MRSDQVHRALAQGSNRYEVCQLVSKAVKVTHKTGSRFEDTINDALSYLGSHESNVRHVPDGEKQHGEKQPTAKLLNPAA